MTPTQVRLLTLLEDGRPRHSWELMLCADDRYTTWATVRTHLSKLRAELRRRDVRIVYEAGRYRLIGKCS